MSTNKTFINKELFVNQLRDDDIVKMEDGFYYSIKKKNSTWQLKPVKNGYEYKNRLLHGAEIANNIADNYITEQVDYFPAGTFDEWLVGNKTSKYYLNKEMIDLKNVKSLYVDSSSQDWLSGKIDLYVKNVNGFGDDGILEVDTSRKDFMEIKKRMEELRLDFKYEAV
ncbi:hypothetical protein ITQ94_09170 [Pediococcus pentosaceus]|uniref:hypothetical protein n=1 Tax=Pediococcus pentosaceus TaxID=1255 RepID=UPI0018FF0AE5|nr:hypothetical protein [Pediococcus pentosaceus]MBF7131607.1 hypothetical protein [Pediococcus pentosaceus]